MPKKKKEVSKEVTVVTPVESAAKLAETFVSNSPVPAVRPPFVYEKLSASMAKTWLSCKRKFYINYVEGIKSDANESFTLGTSCHYALECANRDHQKNPRAFNPLEIGKFIQIFRDKMAELHVHDMALFEIGEELVRNELQNYTAKEKIIGIELEFDVKTPEGVRLYGFIDKLIEVDPTTVRIVDYKTSVIPLSYEEARTDLQLSLYDLVISILYPQYETRQVELRYLRDEKTVKSYRTEIERNNFRKQVVAIDKAIRNFLSSLNSAKSLPNGDLNEFCNWCSYKTSCPQFVQRVSTLLPAAPSVLTITDSNFAEHYQKVQMIYKAAEEWKDTYKTWLVQRLEQQPDVPVIDAEGREASLMSSTMREYDVVGIGKVIGLDDLLGKSTQGVPLVKIQNKNLETYLKSIDDPKIQKKVDKFTTVRFKAPSIKINKGK
jgi:CRISPR/Cas system-associated exonuclease Cas4 (RecB family)